MDPKEMRKALKKAHESIGIKDFAAALRLCNKVAAHESNQKYKALVFMGVAQEGLGSYEEARDSYSKAIDISPDELLAWKGLAALCEKHFSSDHAGLIKSYQELISRMKQDDPKRQEMLYKLSLAITKSGSVNSEKLAQIQRLMTELEDPRKVLAVKACLAEILIPEADHTSKFLSLCRDLWQEDVFEDSWKKVLTCYIQHLYKQECDVGQVVTACERIVTKFPDSNGAHNILAEITCHKILADLDVPIQMVVNQNSPLSDPLRSLLVKLSSKPEDTAYTSSPGVQLVDKLPETIRICGHICLVKDLLNKKEFKDITVHLAAAEDCLAMLPPCIQSKASVQYRNIIDDLKIDYTYRVKQYFEVIRLCEQAIGTGDLHTGKLILSYIETGGYSKAASLLQTAPTINLSLAGYLAYRQENVDDAYLKLEGAVSTTPRHVQSHVWLGQVCTSLPGKAGEGLKHLLMAAKLDPQCEQAFLHLGLTYMKSGDTDRGLKCLKKSYSLDQSDVSICQAYVDALITQSEFQTAKEILTDMTNSSPTGCGKWAWFRLGNVFASQGEITEAINCLQQALRADNDDSDCWEYLADCYVKRGSYVTAIKAYNRVAELKPGSIYPLYQIALINYKLKVLEQSRQQFAYIILNMDAKYTPALKGLGDVHISLAKEALKQSVYKRAASNISTALVYLTRAACLRSDLCCTWKSLGDCLLLTYKLPHDTRIACPVKLLPADKPESEIGCEVALQIGARCYSQALHLKNDDSYLWHDLALACLYQSRLTGDVGVLDSSVKYISKAISLDNTVSVHYCLLGTLYMESSIRDSHLSQAYLIKSIELNCKNVQAWTNLALLYLMNEDIELAHEAFSTAQSVDPEYVECWVGQASIAETMAHSDTMDLFRHTTELSFNRQSVLGYAHWVINTLLNEGDRNSEYYRYSIDRMQAVPVACDGLAKLNDLAPTAQSLNAFGLLLERQGLLRAARTALRSCLSQAKGVDESNVDAYRSNLARVLCVCGGWEESLSELDLLSTLSKNDMSVKALSLYKLSRFPEAFQCYSDMLGLVDAGSTTTQTHIYAAMGMLAVKCNDADTAMTALFQSSQAEEPSIHGLASLCSFALLSGKGDVAVAALNELLKAKDTDETRKLKAVFKSYFAILQSDSQDLKKARNSLLSAIHCYPTDVSLKRQLMLLYLNQNEPAVDRGSILRLCQSDVHIEDLTAVFSLLGGDLLNALRQAQSVVHRNPAAYAACQVGLSHVTSAIFIRLLKIVSGRSDILTELSDDQINWLREIEACMAMSGVSQKERQRAMEQIHGSESGTSMVKLLRSYINGDKPSLIKGVVDSLPLNKAFGYVLLGNLCGEAGDVEFLEALSEGIQVTNSKSLTIYLANYYLTQCLEGEDKSSELFSLLNSDYSSSSKLLQAIYHHRVSKNHRLAIKLFKVVLELEANRDSYKRRLAEKYLFSLSKD